MAYVVARMHRCTAARMCMDTHAWPVLLPRITCLRPNFLFLCSCVLSCVYSCAVFAVTLIGDQNFNVQNYALALEQEIVELRAGAHSMLACMHVRARVRACVRYAWIGHASPQSSSCSDASMQQVCKS